MLSSSRRKALNKNARFETNSKSEYTSSDKGFDENSVSTSRKSCFHSQEYLQKPNKMVSTSRNVFFFFLNWPTFNFKNGVLQQKRAPNKSKRFIFCQKPFPLARMKNLLKNTISVDQKTASIRISVWKKLKKTVSTNRNKIFLNIGLLLMTSIERKY